MATAKTQSLTEARPPSVGTGAAGIQPCSIVPVDPLAPCESGELAQELNRLEREEVQARDRQREEQLARLRAVAQYD